MANEQKEEELLMKRRIINVAIVFISTLIVLMAINVKVEATTGLLSKEGVEDTIINLISTINSEGLNQTLLTEAANFYEEISDEYTNKEIASIIKKNKDTLVKNGVEDNNINTIVKVLENISTEQTKNIINTIDIEELGKKIDNGATVQDIITDITSSLTTTEKVNLVVNMVTSINIVRNILIIFAVICLYRTLLRCVIYKKAGKHVWAAFVPIYRNVTMLKVCKMSPWWLLLLLVPVVGWIILWLVSVASKFMLAEKFGKGVGFSFGLWLLPVIFETILALSKRTKYINNEE